MADEKDPFESSRMTLGEHLSEMRRRLIRCALAFFIALIVCGAFYEQITDFLREPMDTALAKINSEQVDKYEEELRTHPELPRSTYFDSDDPESRHLKPEFTVSERLMAATLGAQFAVALQVSTYAAVLLAAPVILWELWQFIAAGLYKHERRVVLKFVPVSIGLFLLGVLFGYFVLVRFAFYFLTKVYQPERVNVQISLDSYLELFTNLSLILGGCFQLPILIYALVRSGIVERQFFVKYRRHFIVATFVIAGILTPA
jgi:sec-independent protein translocase protein TatC